MKLCLALVAALVLVLLPAAPAAAAISVSRAELRSGELRVEGSGAAASAAVTVDGGAGVAQGRADSGGRFRVEASGFSSPTCRATVASGTFSVQVTLSGCTASAPPAPPPPPPSTTGPTAPTAQSPVGGASVLQPVTLSWGASTGPRPIVAYAWQVGTTAAFTSVLAWGNALQPPGGTPPTTAKVSGLPNGTYFWRAMATQDQVTDVEGLISGPWSTPASFTIAGSVAGTLPAPVMTGPPQGFQYHPFEFVRNAWNPVPGAHHYLLDYDNEPTFSQPFSNADFDPIPATETTKPIMFGQPFGNLWFRVRAVTADGTRSLPSNVRQVTITFNAPLPPAPILVGPPTGTAAQMPLTLDWTDDANPQTYELQIGQDPNFTVTNQFECSGLDWCVRGIPESQWAIPRLTPGVKYWRVRSEHGDLSPTVGAVSAWSAVRSFTVLPTPPAIAALRIDVMTDGGAPSGSVVSHSETTPALTAFGRVDITTFVLPPGAVVNLTSSDPSVASVPPTMTVPPTVALDAEISTGSFIITAKQVTAPRTVTITASLPTGSKSVTLTVNPGPEPAPSVLPAPTLLSPAEGTHVRRGASVSFLWFGVTGAFTYRVQVDDSSTFTSPLVNRTVTTGILSTSTLPRGTLFWRVRGIDAVGRAGAWSTARRLVVD